MTDNALIPDVPPMAQLARKMANIMGQLKRLRQGGQNSQGWTFTSIDDITDAIRALMAEHGIALFSKMLKATEVKDGKVTRATVDMEFELVCADTGVSKVMSWTGSAEDHSDKAMNKAAVYAEKFWLKSTFLVSTGKDPDASSPRLDRRNEQQPRQQQRPQEPPKPAAPSMNGAGEKKQEPEPLAQIWLTADRKLALVAYAIEDKILEQGDVWSDFLKLAEMQEDDCQKFASGNELYTHVKERAAVILKQSQPTPEPKRYDVTVKEIRFTDPMQITVNTQHGDLKFGRDWLIQQLTTGSIIERHPGEQWVKRYNPATWTGSEPFGKAYRCPDLSIEYLILNNHPQPNRAWVTVKDEPPEAPLTNAQIDAQARAIANGMAVPAGTPEKDDGKVIPTEDDANMEYERALERNP